MVCSGFQFRLMTTNVGMVGPTWMDHKHKIGQNWHFIPLKVDR